ncbi:hypothetical protein AT15_07000 [Kosmotoga arenicorallina S304]|uniref:GTP-binding protein n=1 Tax=Kosmotoga arenicorallina S304 TaxID=1453497 RepID=A0A176K2E8_9BACT|nr:DUF4416 family protein [Kosmotoga arenicorallina]OAA31238.1 hypothetical protein AT15_07000 [Kosmotoga arenicorallina S304]
MGQVKRTEMVNLVMFIFSSYIDYRFTEIEPILEKEFGAIDYLSCTLDFDKYTYFYNEEMGHKLQGKLVSFEPLIHPSELAEIKLKTNEIERGFSIEGKRKINIDPGYIHHAQFVLASTKHWANRIYIGRGINAEVTLMFLNGAFRPLEYTYPNYKDKEYIDELTKIRELYLKKRKEYYR